MNSLFGTAFFGILSAITWGIGDFNGGLAARKVAPRLVVVFSQIAGAIGLIFLAWLWGEAALSGRDMVLSAIAGLIGTTGLLLLYRLLATGDMGIAAPITGVVATAVPVLFGIVTQGLPRPLVLLGFALAVLGVWLVSRPADAKPIAPAKLIMPILTGGCFGAFLIIISQLHSSAVFVPLVVARFASIGLLVALTLAQRQMTAPPTSAWPLIIGCGIMDALGNAFFVAAKHQGRLDVASALSSLYPASTVILAMIFLKERMNRWQAIGVALVLLAIPMIAA